MADELGNDEGPEGQAPHFGIDLRGKVEEIEEDVAGGYRPQKKKRNRHDDHDDAGDVVEYGPTKSWKNVK